MFRALLAHPQDSLHKRHLVYCVRIMSVCCGTVAVKLQPCRFLLHGSVALLGVFVAEVLISQSDTPHSAELLSMSDQLHTETSTSQHEITVRHTTFGRTSLDE
jgi:hypothetical protein